MKLWTLSAFVGIELLVMSANVVDHRVAQQILPSCYDFQRVEMKGTACFGSRSAPHSQTPKDGAAGETDRVIGYGAFGVVW